MTVRIETDLRVTGNLTVNGTMPEIARTGLAMDSNQVHAVPFTSFRVWDAAQTLLPGTAANDDLALGTGTLGTDSLTINAGDLKAAGATTRYALVQYPLPSEYVAGETVTVRVSAGMITTIADTSATVDIQAYKADREGAVGSDLCATAAQDCNSLTFADFDFTITPTGLSPGDMLEIRVALAVNDAATVTAVTATIGAFELLVDKKG